MIGEAGIRNSKDAFTASGERRGFSETHDPYTLQNIVKAMKSGQSRRGEGAFGLSATGLQSVASPEYRTVEKMKADSGRLGAVDSEDYTAAVKRVDDHLRTVFDQIERNAKVKKGWSGGYDAIEQSLMDAAASTKTAAAITKAFAGNGILLTEQMAQDVRRVLQEAGALPTEYFEAKPERAVGLDEIAGLIMPHDTEVEQALDKAGVSYTLYDGTEQDRLEKLNELEGVQFSKTKADRGSMQEVTPEEVSSWLKNCKRLTAQNDTTFDSTYIPLSAHTPAEILKIAGKQDAPMIMQVLKARQALAGEKVRFGNSHGHNLSAAEVQEVAANLGHAEYMAMNGDRFGGVYETESGKTVIATVDFRQSKNPNKMNGYDGGEYNTVVTLFTRENTDDAVEYLDRHGFTEANRSTTVAEETGAGSPFAYNSNASGNSVTQSSRDVKQESVTPAQDAEYSAAVERGDTETAQRMVDEAAGIRCSITGTGSEISLDKTTVRPDGSPIRGTAEEQGGIAAMALVVEIKKETVTTKRFPFLVRPTGLEPEPIAGHAPQTCAYADSATAAYRGLL